jgi:hypothetical protein
MASMILVLGSILKMHPTMKTIYFKKWGWVFLPVHAVGFAATLFAIALSIWFFVALDRKSHSASDTLINWFVYVTCVSFWWKWLAEKTSED